MSYLAPLITLPLTIFCVIFAVSNTGDVVLSLWPVVSDWPVPVYLLGLGMLLSGFLLGAVFVWLPVQKMRLDFWRLRQKAARLEKDLALAEEKLQSGRDKAANIAAALPPPVA